MRPKPQRAMCGVGALAALNCKITPGRRYSSRLPGPAGAAPPASSTLSAALLTRRR
jgi:hypothetical protein